VYLPIRDLVLRARYRHMRRFLAGTSRAACAQHRVLFEKIRRNAESDFGRDHGLGNIRCVNDFRRQVPLTTYEYYRPYVERVKRGEINALFGPGAEVLMFTMTSGTTDQPKFIPITREFVAEYRRGWNLWGVRVLWDHRRLLARRSLQICSDWRKFYTEGGIPCGSISGLAADMAPFMSRVIFLNLRPLAKVTDPLAKHYATLRFTLPKRRMGMLVTANPSTLIELARVADRERENLLRDIHDGTLSEAYDIPGDVRNALRWRTAVRRPGRARQLARLADRRGTLSLREAWPRLEVLSVWTGGSVGAYLPQVRQLYGHLPVRDHGLSASEGRVTIPIDDDTSAGILDYESNYFEFIPEEEHDRPQATILEAHELREGHKYFVVLTTSSGFYRYDICDLVECVGYHGQAPLLRFLNKGASFSSITGEKISEYQVACAVRQAFEDMQLDFGLFTVAPRWADPPGYVLLVEPGPHDMRHEELARSVDRHLGRLNMEYAERLESRRLQPMTVETLAPGTWELFRADRLRRGGTMEQYKHPCLSHDLQFAARIRELAKEAKPVEPMRRSAVPAVIGV
jgi:hypothetical protein